MRIRNMAIYFTADVLCVYSMLRFYSGFMITAFCSRAAYGVEEREYVGTPHTPAKGFVPGPPDPVPSALPFYAQWEEVSAYS